MPIFGTEEVKPEDWHINTSHKREPAPGDWYTNPRAARARRPQTGMAAAPAPSVARNRSPRARLCHETDLSAWRG